MSTEAASRDYTVASVARALKLVGILEQAPPQGLTLTELTAEMGTSKSTTYALARTLMDGGFVTDVQPGPRYRLGMAFVRLGDRAADANPIAELVRPILARLSERTQMTARAAVNDDGYPMFVARIDAPGHIRFHTPLGVRELPHASAAGKAILAELDDTVVARVAAETGLPIRTKYTITDLAEFRADLRLTAERGYGLDDEEDEEGVLCLSTPFFDRGNAVAGAISVTGIKTERSAAEREQLARTVQEAANEVSALLGTSRSMQLRDHAG